MTEPTSTNKTSSIVGPRVLIVEDEVLVAMLLEDMLIDLGCEIVGPAFRVEEGIRLLGEEKIDAAVLDVNVAGAKVYPVADILAARKVPFVFSTGYGSSSLREIDRVRPVLQKPFRLQDLERAIVASQR